jgi:hypothetical protein
LIKESESIKQNGLINRPTVHRKKAGVLKRVFIVLEEICLVC